MPEKPYFSRVRVTVIDGAGCGEALERGGDYPDDKGANSLANASQKEPIDAPALLSLGLHLLPGLENIKTCQPKENIEVKRGAFGVLTPTFKGKGSPEGHQALMGHIVLEKPYIYFDKTGFPPEVVDLVRETVSRVVHREVEIVRNRNTDDIGGVKFINTSGIGDKHVASKDPKGPLVVPIYASTESLIQIALHQDVIPQEQIEEIGKAVRAAVNEKGWRIARIIMRPFVDDPEHKDGPFKRVSKDRRDYGMDPDEPTLIDYLKEVGIPVYGVGKAASMLNYHGFDLTRIQKLGSDELRMKKITDDWKDREDMGPRFSFDNIIGLDENYGHPRKPKEWVEHLNMIDSFIARGMLGMADDDLWIITADHGNDPTHAEHTNHTYEMVPVLAFSPRMKKAVNLGIRASFSDVAKTVAENFGVEDKVKNGTSFLRALVD